MSSMHRMCNHFLSSYEMGLLAHRRAAMRSPTSCYTDSGQTRTKGDVAQAPPSSNHPPDPLPCSPAVVHLDHGRKVARVSSFASAL
jgi:hypothetical protein